MGKVNKAEAQEWLESLQQVGEGWWRQVALAVSVGAHTSLGLDRREFAQAIGQRMVDSRAAILELHREKHSQRAIADILSVSAKTVRVVLAEEGLADWTPELEEWAGKTKPEDADRSSAGKNEDDDRNLQAQIDALALQVQGEKAKAKREMDKAKEKAQELRASITEMKREMQEAANTKLTPADKERATKEAEAWAEEQGRKILAGFAHITVDSIVGNLEEAASEMRLLIEQQAVTTEAISEIESAKAGFEEELNVARMTVAETRR